MRSLLSPDAFLTFGSREMVSPGSIINQRGVLPKCQALFWVPYVDPSLATEVWFQHWCDKHLVSPSEKDTKEWCFPGLLPHLPGGPRAPSYRSRWWPQLLLVDLDERMSIGCLHRVAAQWKQKRKQFLSYHEISWEMLRFTGWIKFCSKAQKFPSLEFLCLVKLCFLLFIVLSINCLVIFFQP